MSRGGRPGRSGGHNRKSIEQHKLDGTYNVTKHGKVLPDATDVAKVKPQTHVTSDHAIVDRDKLFSQFADYLYGEGASVEVDTFLVSQLVEAQAAYVTAMNAFKVDPDDAKIGGRAALTVANEQAKEIRIIMAEFRMLPSSRGAYSPKTKTEAPADPVADWLEEQQTH